MIYYILYIIYYIHLAAPNNRHRAGPRDPWVDPSRNHVWTQNSSKIATRWPQDGLLASLGAIWVARWPQDGAKRVPREPKSIRSP